MKLFESRWYLLTAICLAGIALVFNRNILVPIQDQLIDYYGINSIKYNLLQSLYSWPNVIAAICCGIFVDKIGINKMLFITYLIIICGQITMFISSLTYLINNQSIQYLLLCISRCLIGIANESLLLTNTLYPAPPNLTNSDQI
eukprot:34007_1